jgi:hypothetical protein
MGEMRARYRQRNGERTIRRENICFGGELKARKDCYDPGTNAIRG